jgi:hypothetical protein
MKRYTLQWDPDHNDSFMEPCVDGDWVKADTAEAKIAELTEDRDLWKQSEASCARHNRELWARVIALEEALKEVVRTLRYQARLAVLAGGEVALYEGNATAWEQARAALKEDT